MRMQGSSLVKLLLVLGLVGVAFVHAVDDGETESGRRAAAAMRKVVNGSTVERSDAGPSDTEPVALLGVPDDNCQQIGAFDVFFEGPNRFRGDAFRIDATSQLDEFLMELRIPDGVSVDLFFSVHRRPAGSTDLFAERFQSGPVSSLGTGLPEPYPTNPAGVFNAPIQLEAGFDYAIGVSWGASFVEYATDRLLYPRPFTDGLVLGSVIVNNAPPPRDPELSLVIFTNGAYSMQLCLAPKPGACCIAPPDELTPGRCEDVLEADCGGFFFGERTTCAETPCDFGACCDACGDCADNNTPLQCTAGGGTHWPGVSCPIDGADLARLCPQTTGACCEGTTCTELCQAECESPEVDGIYRGDGTSCEPNICGGACCVSGGCADLTATDCATFGLSFQGEGTTCNTLSSELECGGACCFGFTSLFACSQVASRSQCTTQFTQMAYLGDNRLCPNDPADCKTLADYGACCLPDGTCINTDASFCGAPWVRGEFSGVGIACSTITCTLGACCFLDGMCDVLTETGCLDRNGTWSGAGTMCDPGVCTAATGACCASDGGCTDETEAACTAGGGIHQGDGVACDINTCPGFGSCCVSGMDCIDRLTQSECEAVFDGLYQGNTASCDVSGGDCDLTGACCAATGACLSLLAEQCTAIEGEFRVVGMACAADTCLSGACCVNGDCITRTELACTAAMGKYIGDDSTCDSDLCALGACCHDDGSCAEGLEGFDCLASQDVFQVGATCAQANCPLAGACCNTSIDSCDELIQSACAAAERPYAGDGTRCSENGGDICTTGACCDGSVPLLCREDFVFECGGFFSFDAICADEPCPGACCLLTGNCLSANKAECATFGGLFTEAVDCSAVPCGGACCLDDGTCSVLSDAGCTDVGGEFSQGQSCDAATCVGRGACCIFGDCVADETEDRCAIRLGAYQGDASVCLPLENDPENPCSVGGCCRFNGVCEPDRVASECLSEDDDVFQLGVDCGNFLCEAKGACCLSTGECLESTASACSSPSIYGGDNTRCGDASCITGGCCMEEAGVCADLTQDACTTAMGHFLGDGADCDLACGDSGQPCAVDADCGLHCSNSSAVCTSDQDCWKCTGSDRTCVDSADCKRCTRTNLPCQTGLDCKTCSISGGPCMVDGDCATGETCEFMEFCVNVKGETCDTTPTCIPDATCDSLPCARGECCRVDGTADCPVTAAECVGDGEVFEGEFFCAVVPCNPRGACCVSGSCAILASSVCMQVSGAAYAGDGTTCMTDNPCAVGACCMPDESCDPSTPRHVCEQAGGVFAGAGSVCNVGLCSLGACCETDGTCRDTVALSCPATGGSFDLGLACANDPCTGACCLPDGTCSPITATACAAEGGQFTQGGDCNLSTCEAFGACCGDGLCSVMAAADCVAPGDFYQGDGALCDAGVCNLGACCRGDGTCEDFLVASACGAMTDLFNVGSSCGAASCNPTGACCFDALPCRELSELDCTAATGAFRGVGVVCSPDPCGSIIEIASSVPPGGTSDAGQPSEPDGTSLAGLQSMDITFTADASGLMPGDFMTEEIGGDGVADDVISVTPVTGDPLTVTVALSDRLEPGTWTRITHRSSGTSVCLGYLSGDVDANGTADPATDIPALLDCLDNPATCTLRQGDINRDGEINVADLTRSISLFNGASMYVKWSGIMIGPSPCVAGP